jgi:hypothetical protein
MTSGVPSYAGIGSRQTPAHIQQVMRTSATRLAGAGYNLRTGGASGADTAFHHGAHGAGGAIELYLPWPGFAGGLPPGERTTVVERPSAAAYELAAAFHPAWKRLTATGRALHARNSHQVLGLDLGSPATFVLCWTPDGSRDGESRESGGTGQALRIADSCGIAVLNLAQPEHLEHLNAMLAGRTGAIA